MALVDLIDGSDKRSQILIDTQMFFKMSHCNFLWVDLDRDCDWERGSGDDDGIVEHGLGIERHSLMN